MKNLIGLIVVLLILVGFLVGGIKLVYIYDQSPSEQPIKPLDSFEIYNLVNDYRAQNNLPKLSWNPTVCEFTAVRLKQIQDDYSHLGFNPQFRKFYNSSYAGENLIQGYYPEQNIVNAWIKSPEHKENILNTKYTQTCVKSFGFYIVQEFASDF